MTQRAGSLSCVQAQWLPGKVAAPCIAAMAPRDGGHTGDAGAVPSVAPLPQGVQSQLSFDANHPAYPMVSIGYVVNAVIAWAWPGESLSLIKVVGIGIIILGVLVLARA